MLDAGLRNFGAVHEFIFCLLLEETRILAYYYLNLPHDGYQCIYLFQVFGTVLQLSK